MVELFSHSIQIYSRMMKMQEQNKIMNKKVWVVVIKKKQNKKKTQKWKKLKKKKKKEQNLIEMLKLKKLNLEVIKKMQNK